jgi:hypothetical protein
VQGCGLIIHFEKILDIVFFYGAPTSAYKAALAASSLYDSFVFDYGVYFFLWNDLL